MMPQPPPIHKDEQALWDKVIARMQQRDAVGIETYGTRLQPFNGRDFGEDLMAELLDAAVYLEGVMVEKKRQQEKLAEMKKFLKALSEWDMLSPGGTADGPYWQHEIQRLLDLLR